MSEHRKTFRLGIIFGLFVLFSLINAPIGLALAQTLAPPPPPEIPPIISEVYECDEDGDRLDDELQLSIQFIKDQIDYPSKWAIYQDHVSTLLDLIPVRLIFKEPITQRQIDAFLELGGEIDYIYKAVSYGWNGWIPLMYVDILPNIMGDSLVLVQGPREMVAYMDLATQTGRVRPIWKNNFAGNPLGFNGDPSITIGIVDTGVDESHPDLYGRRVYWRDFSDDIEKSPTPIDHSSHGSFVAGIALGTGQAGGDGPGTLYYTTTSSRYSEPISLTGLKYFESNVSWQGQQADFYFLEWPEGKTWWQASDDGPLSVLLASDGYSPLRISDNITGRSGYLYLPFVQSKSSVSLENIIMWSSVTDYPGSTDGFNKFRGVAPDCKWAAAKIEQMSGIGYVRWTTAAVDDLTSKRQTLNIKIINVSGGTESGKTNTDLRDEVNSAVRNGIVVVAAAGNSADLFPDPNDAHKREITDPGRAAMALTVVATNDRNGLTSYSSYGFINPGSSVSEQDFKPDVAAPGGSDYFTGILSVDSGTSDGYGQSDRRANDYTIKGGTSLSSPFVAGCAALVIDAMQQKGVGWDFYSIKHPLYVKMVLCATATETGQNRENDQFNPTLQRANGGPNGFPAGKDPYEGYGIVNPDAAVEAVYLDYSIGSTESQTLGSGPTDRRAWARTVTFQSGKTYNITLTNPSTGDFDLYLYSAEPSPTGTPQILSSSTQEVVDVNESISGLTYQSTTKAILVVKRVSGYGTFTIRVTERPAGQLQLKWTWMKGSNTGGQRGVYGTQGEPNAANTPGARSSAVSWTDSAGKLWLLGGSVGISSTGKDDCLNDLWRYDPVTGNWTWIKGSSTMNQSGVYGTQGVPNVQNTPGARSWAVSWTDSSGKLWLFGGLYSNYGYWLFLNDLWRYDPTTNNWTWMKGSSTVNQSGVYGTRGVPNVENTPGARRGAVSWTDSYGKLWLFGGYGYSGYRHDSEGIKGGLNDLWRYDPVTGNWTWMKGGFMWYEQGVYGTLGVPNIANTPGARDGALAGTDSSGKLWLFGGWGYDNMDTLGHLNELWRYDPVTGYWTWMKGSSNVGQSGIYGTMGVPNVENTPGARSRAVSWIDSSGKLWLFGGWGFDSIGRYGLLNDLWRYDPVTNNWTWMKGSNTLDQQSGIYGTQGVPTAANTPGARGEAVSWTDSAGKLWLFGGYGVDSEGYTGYLNDLWRLSFEP